MIASLMVSVVFSSIKELKEAISHYVITKHYETSIIKFNSIKYTMKYSKNRQAQMNLSFKLLFLNTHALMLTIWATDMLMWFIK